MPDFDTAGAAFLNSSTLQQIYGFHKPGWPADAYTYLMNESACVAYIGGGSQYRDWGSVSNSLNTWVLPFTGLLLQAPFDSNDFLATFWAILRWTGGSMASLSYVLWNMRTSANCAAFVDKATHRNDIPAEFDEDEKGHKRNSDFSSIRDAFFILSAMNQFTVNTAYNGASAEKLLKIALFSRQLRLKSGESDIEVVRKLKARDSRESRQRGTVQCFLSMGWFLFGMVISIQQAFGLLGQNEAAHDLALGLNVIWFPVLMLCTTVDRNPAVPDATMRNLNAFVAKVREALLHDFKAYKEIHGPALASRVSSSDTCITAPPAKFAGMNSVREFSPTSPISSATGLNFGTDDSQNWFMSSEFHSADDLRWINSIADPALDGAKFFTHFAGQGRVFWHYGVAHPILSGLQNDGILNPQRGWLYDSDVRCKLIRISNPERKDRLHSFDLREGWQFLIASVTVWTACMSAFIISYFTGSVGLGCRSLGYLVFAVNQSGMTLIEMGIWYYTPHHKHNTIEYKRARFWGLWFLRFTEFANTAWLMYSIFAQVLGSYNTCKCKVSDYGIGGGFINWIVDLDPSSTSAKPYWIAGTAMGCANLMLCFGFIAWEWVTQSHMSSENYGKAMKGLRATRRFKSFTRFCLPFQA